LPDTDRVQLRAGVPLASFSTLGVGGPARWFVRATDADQIAAADRWAAENEQPVFVLGGGSNVVIADEGFDGLVLHADLRGTTFTAAGEETMLRAAAGEPWDRVVDQAVGRELAGLECLSGIPGSVGGTPIQNVGAYGQEVAGTIESVTAYDRHARDHVTLGAGECDFAYRMSRFKTRDAGRFVVCEVAFRLHRGDASATYPDVVRYLDEARVTHPTLLDVRSAVLAIRRRKGMVVDPVDADSRSVGSFFMNPIVSTGVRDQVSSRAGQPAPAYRMDGDRVKLAAAWLIEQSGLHKGFADGAAGISAKHPLALVNRGGATARDVLRLAVRVKRQVADRFNVLLRPEPIFVGFHDDPDVEYLQRDF
jgi:UDP-N-acetylmuramate dehydrogenase